MKETIDHIKDMFDDISSMGSNMVHLQHVLEGYRDRVMDDEITEDNCPYSPGAAREGSWNIGRLMAQNDLANRGPMPDGMQDKVLIRVIAQINTGKSTVAHLVKNALVTAGFPEIVLEDMDWQTTPTHMEKRIDALVRRPIKIDIRTIQLRRRSVSLRDAPPS